MLVSAVFDSPQRAEEAKRVLLDAGVPAQRIAVSAHLTADGIAAEAPGQAFENQPGQGAGQGLLEENPERWAARFGEAARSGTCVLSVRALSEEERLMTEALLRRNGAYRTLV
jgi:hypothetical protein